MWKIVHGEGKDQSTAVLESKHHLLQDAVTVALQVVSADPKRSALVFQEGSPEAITVQWNTYRREACITELVTLNLPLLNWLEKVKAVQPF